MQQAVVRKERAPLQAPQNQPQGTGWAPVKKQ